MQWWHQDLLPSRDRRVLWSLEVLRYLLSRQGGFYARSNGFLDYSLGYDHGGHFPGRKKLNGYPDHPDYALVTKYAGYLWRTVWWVGSRVDWPSPSLPSRHIGWAWPEPKYWEMAVFDLRGPCGDRMLDRKSVGHRQWACLCGDTRPHPGIEDGSLPEQPKEFRMIRDDRVSWEPLREG